MSIPQYANAQTAGVAGAAGVIGCPAASATTATGAASAATALIEVPVGGVELGVQMGNTIAQTIIQSFDCVSNSITSIAQDWYSWIKTFALDTFAYALKQALVAKLTGMMIQYVKTGFNGGPAYVQNPGRYYGNINNSVTQTYLYDLDQLKRSYSPESLTNFILDDTQRRLEQNAYMAYRQAITPAPGEEFPGGRAGYTAYLNDFDSCPTGNGWDCWNAMGYATNNPWDVAMAEQQELQKRQYEALTLAQNEINAANGFATVKSCVKSIMRNNTQQCVDYLTKIPGKVIIDQLSKYQAAALDELHNVHSINEFLATAIVDLSTSWMKGGL